MSTDPAPLAEARSRLSGLMLRDQHRLRRRIDGARSVRDSEARASIARQINAAIDAASQRVERRRTSVPQVTYPEQLPVSQRKDEILTAIRDHQVVIVAGETGSGKTTQLPKICLELGRGVYGTIGHTQPRRLAARTVAERVAEELGVPLGEAVGYSVRFTDQVSDGTLVKLMTDGILLTEISRDRLLRQYDTLIIDEAHERSLNIDFILGYLKQLLPRRPDLKVILTSATIDPQRFSRHFDDAPVIEVSGRTYPVELRYRPFADDPDRDQTQAISDAVDELCAEGPGDILVFLSGEREIRDTADTLNRRNLPHTEIVPLYARLSASDQHRVFQQHTGRRIVLATNVAETSLTVPGIHYVIDPGTARISRYSRGTKVQRLPIEAISQASARQRAGRCGRVADGICVRLYTEEEFESRPAFTDPEILRTNLASVILRMTALGLGDLRTFPFVDPPDRRNIRDGVLLLNELGALEGDVSGEGQQYKLTRTGRTLAELPIDPRLARMIVEGDRNGCLREVLVIVSALAIQDPRERPSDATQAADQMHNRFVDKDSDFIGYLNLWDHLREQRTQRSSNQFRRMCRTEFLNYLRVREWQDLYGQLSRIATGLDMTVADQETERAAPDLVHASLLAGLLSHIGLYDSEKREYVGARNARFAIFPGSTLFKRSPRWVMAAELVETSRLWGRITANINPGWIEPLAGHLVKRTYSEPHWEARRGAVIAHEKVLLYGVPIVASRPVNYGRIDPELCRELFIRHALVGGEWRTHHAFFHANRELLADAEELEHRARRRDIVVDDETLFDFYDKRIGAEVVSVRHFDSWWKRVRAKQPDLLDFSTAMLVNDAAGAVSKRDYPDVWHQGRLDLALDYVFEPGDERDGVTVNIPVRVLNQVTVDGFDWQVPGLRLDLVTALIRSLPKQVRRHFIPAPDVAARALQALPVDAAESGQSLLSALEQVLTRMTGVPIARQDWQTDRVPAHLRVTFRVLDEDGATLASGKDLDALKRRLREHTRAAVASVASGLERHGLLDWDLDTLPTVVADDQPDNPVKAYPALVDEGDSVGVGLFDTEEAQRHAMWLGTRRLLLVAAPPPTRLVRGALTNRAKLALGYNPHGGVPALLDDCYACAADALIARHGGPAWDAAGFAALRDAVRGELTSTLLEVVGHVEVILASAHETTSRLSELDGRAPKDSIADMRAQLAELVYPGFVTATGYQRLADIARYLRALRRRLDKLADDPYRDSMLTGQVEAIVEDFRQLLDDLPPETARSEQARQIRWMIEELRVSLFAQQVGTAYPISEKRVRRAMAALPG